MTTTRFNFTRAEPQSGVITVPYNDLANRFDKLVVYNIKPDQATQLAHSARAYARNHGKRYTCKRSDNTLTIERVW